MAPSARAENLWIITVTWAAFSSLRKMEHPALASHGFLWLMLLYMIAVSAGPEAYGRFRAPLVPLFAIYAGRGLAILLFGAGRNQQSNIETKQQTAFCRLN